MVILLKQVADRAGGNGAAIRRTSGFTVTINNNGTIAGDTNATGIG